MIIIDYSPIVMSAAFSSWPDHKKNPTFHQYSQYCEVAVLQKLRYSVFKARALNGMTPNEEVVVALDSRPYWRRDLFPNYKRNRKPLREGKDDVPWDDVWDVSASVSDFIKNVSGWKLLSVPTCEADDIIGTLVGYTDHNVTIVSRDGDFKQLHSNSVQQYDNITHQLIKENNPDAFLHKKIITGDRKDGIPNIVSDINTFLMENTKQSPISKKKIEAWLNQEPSYFCDSSMFKRYKQNQKLLDLSMVPNNLGNIFSWLSSRGHSSLITFTKDFT
jgi:5'-3' exonuclease